MSEVLTEGRVSKNILSFGKEDFLFTGTVCRSWRENSVGTQTSAKASVESVSRVKEAFECHICTDEAAFVAIEEGASMSVFKAIYDRGFCWWDGVDLVDAVHLEVAAIHGRADVLEFLTPLGPLGAVQYDEKFLRKAVNLCKYDDKIVEVVRFLLNTGCPVDKHLSGERSLEAAIYRENLELIKTLCTADFHLISGTFKAACETKNVDIIQYLCIELLNGYPRSDYDKLRVLNWLHDEMGCDIGFSSFEEMKNDTNGQQILESQSKAIVDWFKNKLN